MEALMESIVTEDNGAGVVRYMSRDYTTYKEAFLQKNNARKLGYPDAFVVGYKDGARMSANETLKYQHK